MVSIVEMTVIGLLTSQLARSAFTSLGCLPCNDFTLGGPNFFRFATQTPHSKGFFNLIAEHIFILKSVEKPLITSWSKNGPKIGFFADYD